MITTPVLSPHTPQTSETKQQSNSILSVASRCFAEIKETLSGFCKKIVACVKIAFSQVSFIFFRVFNWVYPKIGLKVEVAFLRMQNAWASLKGKEAQKGLKLKIEHLTLEKQSLNEKIRRLQKQLEAQGVMATNTTQLDAADKAIATPLLVINKLLETENQSLKDRIAQLNSQQNIPEEEGGAPTLQGSSDLSAKIRQGTVNPDLALFHTALAQLEKSVSRIDQALASNPDEVSQLALQGSRDALQQFISLVGGN